MHEPGDHTTKDEVVVQWGPARDGVVIMTISAEAKNAVTESRLGGWLLVILVAVMLAGLPLAVWLDLSNLSRTALSRQAEDLSSVITGIRGYYATNVVGRILAS